MAIGDRLVLETQGVRRHNRADWRKVLLPGQDVDDDIGGMNAVRQSLCAGRIDREQSVRQHSGEDLHHLPVAIVAAAQFAPDPIQPDGRAQSRKGAPFLSAPGFLARTGT